jgi:hypothetical protein
VKQKLDREGTEEVKGFATVRFWGSNNIATEALTERQTLRLAESSFPAFHPDYPIGRVELREDIKQT